MVYHLYVLCLLKSKNLNQLLLLSFLMVQFTRKKTLNIILICALLGLITSIYLLKNHYIPSSGGSFCDLSSRVSCSMVNTSVFSELFGVPVALLGALWFLWLIIRCRQAQKSGGGASVVDLFVWNILGLAFIVYFIVAEIFLGAICLLCTFVHMLISGIFLLSLSLYQKEEKVPFARAVREMRGWIITAVIIFSLPFILFNISGNNQNHDVLAQCLTTHDVTLYCSSHSPLCAKTRAMFGSSFQFIKEVECYSGKNGSLSEQCQLKKISTTPAWIIARNGTEVKRFEGFLTINELSQFADCKG